LNFAIEGYLANYSKVNPRKVSFQYSKLTIAVRVIMAIKGIPSDLHFFLSLFFFYFQLIYILLDEVIFEIFPELKSQVRMSFITLFLLFIRCIAGTVYV